jgi:GntR family transcriptional regulator
MNIHILNSSNLPIYLQIKNQLIEQILKGELKEGTKLPSIRQLAKDLQISVITTKRAYEELEREGYIHSVPGKGSYVSLNEKELLKQKQMEIISSHLREITSEAKKYGISLEQIIQLLEELYKEG